MDALICGRCGAERDLEDNFCRRCGTQFTVTVPAVRKPDLPAPARSLPPSLIGSVAVLALGTGLEWAMRRLARNAAGAAGRAILGQERLPARNKPQTPQEDVSVDELVYVRRIQLRR